MHKDIAQRLARKYEDAEGLLSLEIDDLKREREKGLLFSHIANKRVGPNGERIYELLWILENLRGKIHDVPIQFSIANASRLTREQITVCIEKLEDAARLRGELPDSIIKTWQGFRPKGIMPEDAERICSTLISLETELERLSVHIEENRDLIEKAGIDPTMGLLRTLTNVNVITLDSPPADFDEEAGIKFLETKNLDLLKRLDESINKYLRLMSEAQPIVQALSVLPAQRANEVVCVTDALIKADYGDKNLPALRDISDKLGLVLECIQLIQGNVAPVVDCYHEPPSRLNEILRVLKMYTLMKKSPKDLEIHIHAGHALEIAESLYGTARQECTQLSGDYRELCQVFEQRVLPEHEEITSIALTLRKHKNSLFAFLSGEYRQAKRSVKVFLVDKKLFRSVQLPELLERMADTIRRIQAVKIHEDYSRVLGPLYHGIETDWNHLYNLVSWAQEFRNIVESQRLALSLMQNLNDVRERLMRVSPNLQKNYEYMLDKAGGIGLALDHDSDLRQEADKISNLRTAIERALGVVPNNELFGGLDVAVINASVRAYLSALDLCDKIAEDNNLKHLLGSRFKGVETDLKTLLSAAEWVQDLVEKSGLPKKIVKWLVESRMDAKMSLLKGLLTINREIIRRLDEACRELASFGSIDVGDFFGDDNSLCQAVRDNVRAYIDAVQYLVTLSDYHRCIDEADQLGLKRLTDRIHSKQLDFEECSPLYKFIVYGSIAKEVINEYGELAGFTRAGHENAVNRFAALDKQLMKKMAKHIAYELYQRPVPFGIGTGPVRDYTDRCLLVHEIHKKKKHIPIRQLVRRAGTALKALKPCFMMSPLSVAQYLEPGKIEFDLVVMDEASQIRPADAIGAIARANQLVIVGDPHQLPPTSFFERLGGDEYAEDAYAVTDTESILDVCMTIYPKRRLRWHYRSRHESLIAFSNNRFYDDDLIVFPTNQKNESVYGVKHHYIEGATYLKGRNRDEATAVVHAIINHIRNCPGESLGVATFNREQSELMLDVLERFQKNDQWLEKQLKELENSNEPFFIKNLENVQGDERDVIFISTTYGPDPASGQVYQRFGPITEEVGWRRLNVIITRAKKRVEVFTSMRSTDVRPTESSSRGVRALKEYLEYAEKGLLTDPGIAGTGKEPGSDFELSVARILKTHGYKVMPQVGVAGFFIDIGVRHPYREREFIVGIECDGATYHSAKSVRDRDRLRQEILESKGWKIHRIWSVDWFKNREKEIQRLLNTISTILKAEPEVAIVKDGTAEVKKPAHGRDDHQKATAETAAPRQLEDWLREELALYNATNIQPRFPDIKNGILRDEMLELFVKRRPTTKDEFYQSIPQHLRTNTYGKQMQFLEDILDIIEGYAD